MAYRGPRLAARPENAIQRADELQKVGQHKQALQSLHDMMTSRKHRTWNKNYEDIMYRLITLAVEQKNTNMAKEALMQYRNMCQQVNINSLEEVIRHYINTATDKAEEAREQAEVGGTLCVLLHTSRKCARSKHAACDCRLLCWSRWRTWRTTPGLRISC